MEKEFYLNRLIGKFFTSTTLSTNITIPINESTLNGTDELFTLSNLLYFEDYRLQINNPISIVPSDKILNDLMGLKVIATDEKEKEAEIIFDNGYKVIVNMHDEAYYDPEAMCLYGPNDFWVVWN